MIKVVLRWRNRGTAPAYNEVYHEREVTSMVTMYAEVVKVCCGYLLVCDLCERVEVRVNTERACCFHPGEKICIRYNGAMTLSLPPQISADRICHVR